LFLWLVFWFFTDCFLLIALLWNTLGKEEITILGNELTIKRILLFIIKSKVFNIHKIYSLRVSEMFYTKGSWNYNMAYWGLKGEVINLNMTIRNLVLVFSLTRKAQTK
jgi:hypothetical protein